MDVVQDRVGVFHGDFLIGLHREDLWRILATFLIHYHGAGATAGGLAGNALQRNDDVGQPAIRAHHIKVSRRHVRVEFAAVRVIFQWGNILFLGCSAFQCDRAGDVAGGC